MLNKNIIGVDYSITSPAVCFRDNGKLVFFGYTSLKTQTQYYFENNQAVVMLKPTIAEYDSKYERYNYTAYQFFKMFTQYSQKIHGKPGVQFHKFGTFVIEEFNPNPKLAKNIIDLVEATSFFKHAVFSEYYDNLLSANITKIKKYFTGRGDAKKPDMQKAFVEKTKIDLAKLIGRDWDKHPTEDMIDAYAIMCYGENTPFDEIRFNSVHHKKPKPKKRGKSK